MIEFSKTLKNQASADIYSVEDRQALIGSLVGSLKTSNFEEKVRLFTLAPLAVAEYSDCLATSGVKRTGAEHAEMMGVKGPMFSMMRQVITILTYGSGASREGGWGDVTIGNEKVNVAVAYDRLVSYRSEVRDPRDVILPLADACGAVLGDDGSARFDGLREMFESFPNGLSGVYNIARGRNADGSKVEESDDSDSDSDSSGEITWQVKLTEAIDRGIRQGATVDQITAEFMVLIGKV